MLYIIPTNTCFGLACAIDDIKGYDKIYNIKKRSLDKPLAIMVPDFNWLKEKTDLTPDQIEDLKKYDKPFSVMANCPHLQLWMNYSNEATGEHFLNRDIYESFVFRIAHNDVQKKLIDKVGPIFLTSANYSGEPELYSVDELFIKFGNLIESGKIEFRGKQKDLPKTDPSDIFYYIDDTLEKEYIRD